MKRRVESKKIYEPLKGYCVAVLFYQPSTRTFSSFVAAAKRLGAYVIDIHGMASFSSVCKGETLEDTIRTIHQTTGADAIVIRHPANESSMIAAEYSYVPVLNAGSGKLEHPTQALLDLYTIYSHFKKLGHPEFISGSTKILNQACLEPVERVQNDNTGLHVVMVGDLLYGRTIKSLAKLLALFKNNQISLVAPPQLKAPKELVASWAKKMKVEESEDLKPLLKKADVLYMTRVQKEWFEASGTLDEYEKLKDKYVLTRHMVEQMKKKAIVMHPLPRVGEILREVDEDPRAKYFEQMRSGLYVRMALLEMILLK